MSTPIEVLVLDTMTYKEGHADVTKIDLADVKGENYFRVWKNDEFHRMIKFSRAVDMTFKTNVSGPIHLDENDNVVDATATVHTPSSDLPFWER